MCKKYFVLNSFQALKTTETPKLTNYHVHYTRVVEGGNPSTCFPCEEQANESRETPPYIALDKQTINNCVHSEGLKMEFDNYNSVLHSK